MVSISVSVSLVSVSVSQDLDGLSIGLALPASCTQSPGGEQVSCMQHWRGGWSSGGFANSLNMLPNTSFVTGSGEF